MFTFILLMFFVATTGIFASYSIVLRGRVRFWKDQNSGLTRNINDASEACRVWRNRAYDYSNQLEILRSRLNTIAQQTPPSKQIVEEVPDTKQGKFNRKLNVD